MRCSNSARVPAMQSLITGLFRSIPVLYSQEETMKLLYGVDVGDGVSVGTGVNVSVGVNPNVGVDTGVWVGVKV